SEIEITSPTFRHKLATQTKMHRSHLLHLF
ncbi:unnamed protein product, partial [marine sediment metagenome]